MRIIIVLMLVLLGMSGVLANAAEFHGAHATYISTTQDGKVAVEKHSLTGNLLLWRMDLPAVPTQNEVKFIAEQEGNIALYSARHEGGAIVDPVEVILLRVENGALLTRYWCDFSDATPVRLARRSSAPGDTRALLHVDGMLLAGTYGHGLWRYNSKAWTHITGKGFAGIYHFPGRQPERGHCCRLLHGGRPHSSCSP